MESIRDFSQMVPFWKYIFYIHRLVMGNGPVYLFIFCDQGDLNSGIFLQPFKLIVQPFISQVKGSELATFF